MKDKSVSKYRPFPPIELENRQWPSRVITTPPLWASVDLRDGNQALSVPMNVAQKLELFRTLLKCGFKEIEVGFPSASDTEFAFNRLLIDADHIPKDVAIQVLVQAREDLIDRTFKSLVGAKSAIIHLYNSTSPAQRRVVFGKSKDEIIGVAVQGAKWIKERLSLLQGTDVRLQYSPESFSATEVDFSLAICEAVIDVWQPAPDRKLILNLPCTVEVATPNVYADQIEWMCRHLKKRDSLIISLHTHNDRGTGVAATELGLLAGGDRVEGTLFGNGERTGNLDLITLALNLHSQGIDSGLDFGDIASIREVYTKTTGMTVPERHPYSGELVFTAFSGSHQDAIRKGLAEWQRGGRSHWDVPYLAIDPIDVGRQYREVIRVNGQSGKGGIAYLLEREFGIELPRDLQIEFGAIANTQVDRLGREVTGKELKEMFWREYVERQVPLSLKEFRATGGDRCSCVATFARHEEICQIEGQGNGPIEAIVNALVAESLVPIFQVASYSEHSLGVGEGAQAIAYVQLMIDGGSRSWGVGVDTNIEIAPIRAILSALNRGLNG